MVGVDANGRAEVVRCVQELAQPVNCEKMKDERTKVRDADAVV